MLAKSMNGCLQTPKKLFNGSCKTPSIKNILAAKAGISLAQSPTK
jgi:hypothetical protein